MKEHKVIVYKTQFCPWCHKAEEFLMKHNIKFTSIDVGKDHHAAMEMIKKSGQQGVPVLDIDNHIIVGFDEPQIRRILKITA